ncbi:F-box/kelch-repeat protein At1g57790-like [Rhodamnia argentea]|uniref:F-box/kelch-repeat protein At1g57790-like n=1 Tax=Rhodamnia argentea TaxID=178133 RepID=A0A8B8MUB5_9MYRT|nr:F-box/kelch-repeat protein At1g57790-like [Rhodamnia argentea]
MANWEELPRDILGLIARRLAIEDFLAFRGVCTTWRSAAPKETYSAKSKAPWLMISILEQVAEFFSPSRGKTYKVPLLHLWGGQALSPPGWIFVSTLDHTYHKKCRIFNPLSSVSIELPTLEKLRHKSCLGVELDEQERYLCESPGINMIALSSSPSLSRSYTVMISYSGSPGLAFHRSGEDAWTVVSPAGHLPWSSVLQLIYYDGLFVALDEHYQITTLDQRERRMQLRLVLRQRFQDWPYLVECRGSLLVAWNIWGQGYRTVNNFQFAVFEVDLEKGTQEEVKSLGKASLFLNNNFSFSVEFNETCLPGIKPNCIYFPDYFMKKTRCYSMEDGKAETYSYPTGCPYFPGQSFQPGF